MANPEHLAKLKDRVEAWNEWRRENPAIDPNLSGANLSAADLGRADLREANLSGAHLSGAHLSEANLSGADLREAHLSGANLSGANLRGANLREAHLTGANLSGASVCGAHLREAHLHEAHLSGADLREANFREANLGMADLSGANLREANLGMADLSGANLREAHLNWADLGGANLSWAHLGGAHLGGAHLGGANLNGADLGGADLSGADLTGTNLTEANLTGAKLGGGNLRGADLRGACLDGVDLSAANMTGAQLHGRKEAMAPSDAAREHRRAVLTLESSSGFPLHSVHQFLAAMERAYDHIYTAEVILGTPVGTGIWLDLGLKTASALAGCVPPGDHLVLESSELHSPGAWEFVASLNPLDQIRQYLQGRHERRKDGAYREPLDAPGLELEHGTKELQLIGEKIKLARSRGATDEDLSFILNHFVWNPLRQLDEYQDAGMIGTVSLRPVDGTEEAHPTVQRIPVAPGIGTQTSAKASEPIKRPATEG